MVDSVANCFVETLRDLLVEETKFLLGVSDEVEQVKRDLRRMHALLMKADRERRDSPTLQACIAQLKELALEAENMLETYAVKVESKKKGQRLKEKLQRYICIMCECYNVDQIGKENRVIISRLADLTSKLESELGQESSSLSNQEDEMQHLLRQEHALEVEDHFVGMEKDIEILLSMVKSGTRSQRVVSICGMGGLGKTTLARKIYNHADLQSYTRAWVCITQQFQPKAVLGEILKHLDSNAQIDSMNVVDLVKRIHSILVVQSKCLIVIDDIWQNDHWEIVKKAFPMNCNVFLTTRSESVANQECDHPYKLRFLTEDEGWALLQKIALPQDSAPAETLEYIGKEIVEKCGRLPLAICVIGGILRKKKEDIVAEWKNVNRKMDLYLRHGEGVEEYKKVNQVLELSYDVLPYYLKPCFLYLACFPEDTEIQTEMLYRLWMAEGFISYQDKGPNETLRDVAQRYLTELAMRCMVQVQKGDTYSPYHKFAKCRLHDLMHDLCSSKVEQDNFSKCIVASTYEDDIPSSTDIRQFRLAIRPSIGNSVSRLAIFVDNNSSIEGTISMEGLEEYKNLRSFILFKETTFPRPLFKDTTINLDRSKGLRILVLDNCGFEDDMLPSKVGKLIHLRYLSLRWSSLRELPHFVFGMPYLQTLDLRVWIVLRLPNLIWKMKRLKHLILPWEIKVNGGERLRLDGLDELYTLHNIRSETARIVDIPKLISLRELVVVVRDMDSMTTLAHHMSTNKSQLCETDLSVKSCDFSLENGRDVLKDVLMSPSLVSLKVNKCKIRGGFPYYKEGMCENLAKLKLYSCKVSVDMMEEFGKYPMLQTLDLIRDEITETLIFPSDSFPQLKSLTLKWLLKLKKWEVEERAMPKLTKLTISSCGNLEKAPDGLRFISTLQQLRILRMPKEFKERVREQDYGSVSHIPSLII